MEPVEIFLVGCTLWIPELLGGLLDEVFSFGALGVVPERHRWPANEHLATASAGGAIPVLGVGSQVRFPSAIGHVAAVFELDLDRCQRGTDDAVLTVAGSWTVPAQHVSVRA